MGSRSSSGISTSRPRDGLRPTRPQAAAGMRMEPPPSLAWAMGTTPAATSAADPPLEPPTDRVMSQGLRVAPYRDDSVLAVSPNSGSVVLATGSKPRARYCAIHGLVDVAGVSAGAHEPCRVGYPVRSSLSLSAEGMPAKGPVTAGATSRSRTTALSWSLTSARRPLAASRSSRAETLRRRRRCCSSITSSEPSASSRVESTVVIPRL